MPIPHQEFRRMIRRRIEGLTGRDRIRALEQLLREMPDYYSGPYGELRTWIHTLIAEANTRNATQFRDTYFLARQGAAQVVLVGAPNAGKSSLLKALTGRQVAVGNYPFTTLRPVEGMVEFAGAQVQLVDLPGLTDGAGDGRGGGRAVLAAVRMADALIYTVPLTDEGLAEIPGVVADVTAWAPEVRCGVVGTKLDLEGSGERWAELSTRFPDVPRGRCSSATGEGLDEARRVIWELVGLARVYLKPRGGPVSPDPVVLAPGSTVRDLLERVNRAWLPRFQSARITGPSARFANQVVGLDHVVLDGDTVELTVR